MNITFRPTPFGTVHVSATVPVQDVKKARRSIASRVGKKGLGSRIAVREHEFGDNCEVFAIYRKK